MIPNPQFDTNSMENDDLQNPLYNPNSSPPTHTDQKKQETPPKNIKQPSLK